MAAGEYLFREGDATYDFYVVLSGAVEIVVRSDGEERVITRHGPGRFLGELNLLTGQRVFVSARVVEPARSSWCRRRRCDVIATSPASVTRSWPLPGPPVGSAERRLGAIRVVGSRFSPESLRLREFLARNRIPHEWLDPDRDAGVERPAARVRRRRRRSCRS